MYLNIVMDYIPETVYRVMKHYVKMKQSVPILLVKLYAYQMFRALAYIHALGICHRDIKPQNLSSTLRATFSNSATSAPQSDSSRENQTSRTSARVTTERLN